MEQWTTEMDDCFISHTNISKYTVSYHCRDAALGTSTTCFIRHSAAKYWINRIKEARFSRTDLTNQKDVCCWHVCFHPGFVDLQRLLKFLHCLKMWKEDIYSSFFYRMNSFRLNSYLKHYRLCFNNGQYQVNLWIMLINIYFFNLEQ